MKEVEGQNIAQSIDTQNKDRCEGSRDDAPKATPDSSPLSTPPPPPLPPQPDLSTIKRNANKIANDRHIALYKRKYIISVFILSVISIIFYCKLEYDYKEGQQEIVEFAQKHTGVIIKCNSAINKQTISQIDSVVCSNNENIKGLLELEFSKLQSEFNFLSIWIGTITIVFLVFSIYSIFKTDQLLSKADAETRKIHELLSSANNEYSMIVNIANSSASRNKSMEERVETLERQTKSQISTSYTTTP